MTLNQLIYTSCKKGLLKSSSGFQIYSYDKDFPETGLLDENGLISLLDVEKSEKPSGFILNDETLPLAPREYAFLRITSSKYEFIRRVQQRDYTLLESGRTGNLFRHFIVCDKTDLTSYPCEYLCAENLRDGLTLEEAQSDEVPAYLPTPQLIRSSDISLPLTMEFLREGDHADVLIKMVYALLNSERGLKRIVICDSPENILQWIAAVEYMLPLSLAIDIPFSTYVSNPSRSEYRICGVVPPGTVAEGMQYRTEYTESPEYLEQFYAFDFKKDIIADVPVDNAFYTFLRSCLSPRAYSELEKYHQYVQRFDIISADESYVNAYYVYSLLHLKQQNLDSETFYGAINFLSKLPATHPEKEVAVEKILRLLETMSKKDTSQFLQFVSCFSANSLDLTPQQRERVYSMTLDAILEMFSNLSIGMEEIRNVSQGINLVDEFSSNPVYIKHLSTILPENPDTERVKFLVDVYYHRVIKSGKPDILEANKEMGKYYTSLVQACVSRTPSIVRQIIEMYVPRGLAYLTVISVTLDSIGIRKDITKDIWDIYRVSYLQAPHSEKDTASTYLLKSGKIEEEYLLYKAVLSKIASKVDKINLIRSELLRMAKEPKYIALVKNDVIELIKSYPLDKPGDAQQRELSELFDILNSSPSKISDETVILQFVGLTFDSKKKVEAATKEIQSKIGIRRLSIPVSFSKEKKYISYLTWIVSSIIRDATVEDIKALFDFMSFNSVQEMQKLIEVLTKEYYTLFTKNKKTARTIYPYLSFAANASNRDIRIESEKSFEKIFSKREIKLLFDLLKNEYPKDKQVCDFVEKHVPVKKESNIKLNAIGKSFKKNIIGELFKKR